MEKNRRERENKHRVGVRRRERMRNGVDGEATTTRKKGEGREKEKKADIIRYRSDTQSLIRHEETTWKITDVVRRYLTVICVCVCAYVRRIRVHLNHACFPPLGKIIDRFFRHVSRYR